MTRQAPSPQVTVVCIFLDEERFLREAIESVVAQDFADWELVLVDDGSRDRSGAIAREFAASDRRIRVIEHEGRANLGMSASRNAGVAAGSAPYVTFIDGDDRWPATKLTRQIAVMEAHPDVGAAAGAFRVWESWRGGQDRIDYCGKVMDRITPTPDALLDIYPLGRSGAAAVSAMVTRDLFDEVGGFEESFHGFYEDQAFFVKIYANAPVWFSSEVWQDYRQHPDSCCAQVEAAGNYPKERARLLEWAAGYLGSMDCEWRDEALAAVSREQRRLRRFGVMQPVRKRLAAIKRMLTAG